MTMITKMFIINWVLSDPTIHDFYGEAALNQVEVAKMRSALTGFESTNNCMNW